VTGKNLGKTITAQEQPIKGGRECRKRGLGSTGGQKEIPYAFIFLYAEEMKANAKSSEAYENKGERR